MIIRQNQVFQALVENSTMFLIFEPFPFQISYLNVHLTYLVKLVKAKAYSSDFKLDRAQPQLVTNFLVAYCQICEGF